MNHFTDIGQLNPMNFQMSTHTINFIPDIYDKQVTICGLLKIGMLDTVNKSMAGILSRNDFFFHKIFQDTGFNYELGIMDIKTEYNKILPYIFREVDVTYTIDHLIIDGHKFSHDGYNEIFEEQGNLIEYVGLAFIANQIKKVDGQSREFPEEKIDFTVEEAARFTGYKKSYLYKLKHTGQLKAYQPTENGKLLFKRKDLMAFLYKVSSVTIEDMV